MNIFGIGLKALKEIIDDKISYHIVFERFNSEFNLNKDDEKRMISDVIGSLRHFTFLKYEATNAFPEFDEDADEIYLLIIALFEIRYRSKIVAQFVSIDDACQTAEYMELNFNKDDLKAKLEYLAANKTKLPDTLFKDPYKYNSLFFSTPEWLIKMWAKQYGDETCMNILLANQKHPITFLSLNALKAEKEKIVAEQYYNAVDVCPSAIVYSSNQKFSEQLDAKSGKLFVQDLSLQIMLDQIEYGYGMKVLHINGVTASLSSNVAIRIASENGKVESFFTNERRYSRAKYQYSRLGLKNAKAYFDKIDLLKTYCPFKGYDAVFVTPTSSYLGQIRRRPDILLTSDKKDILSLSKQQLQMLIEAANYVCVGGQLIYSVQTIDLYESKDVIEKFLNDNPNFTLINQRQIFPYEFNSDGLFYAIFRRK